MALLLLMFLTWLGSRSGTLKMAQCKLSCVQHKVSAVMDRVSRGGLDEQMDDQLHERMNDR